MKEIMRLLSGLRDRLQQIWTCPHPCPPPSDGRGRTFVRLLVYPGVSSVTIFFAPPSIRQKRGVGSGEADLGRQLGVIKFEYQGVGAGSELGRDVGVAANRFAVEPGFGAVEASEVEIHGARFRDLET